MKMIIGIALASMLITAASAQESPFRKELKRGDLTGTNMEIITSISELKPGDISTLHIQSLIVFLKVAPSNCQMESKCPFRLAQSA
jgi:hypothetical protein